MSEWEKEAGKIEEKIGEAKSGERVNIDNLKNLSPEEHKEAAKSIMADMHACGKNTSFESKNGHDFLKVFDRNPATAALDKKISEDAQKAPPDAFEKGQQEARRLDAQIHKDAANLKPDAFEKGQQEARKLDQIIHDQANKKS